MGRGGGRMLHRSWLRSSVAILSLAALHSLVVGATDVAQAQEPDANAVALPPVVVVMTRKRPPAKRSAPKSKQPARPAAQTVQAQPAPEGPAAPAPKAASELTVTQQEIGARPFTRPAEVLEAVPGLIITQHSGEGKANQYFLRGYNLDHGTDLAIQLDGMPINMRTHGHGQGYADLNFLIPELVATMDVRKGPYFADEGDFSSVGALHINLRNALDKNIAQVTLGMFGYQRYLGMGSTRVGDGTLLYAGEVGRYNGPWDNPDDMRKLNGVLRYSQGNYDNGFSLTGMAYSNRWNSTDQIPLRAIQSGEIGLYGALDPTDGGNTHRLSVS